MEPLTLKSLQIIFEMTEKKATPHRTPDFEKLNQRCDKDAQVKGNIVFWEENNTGYDGLLERWSFSVTDRDGRLITFMADLLPEIVKV